MAVDMLTRLWNGHMTAMNSERTAPAISPKVRTMRFMECVLAVEGGGPGILAAAAWREAARGASPEGVISRREAEIIPSGDEPRVPGALDGLRPAPRVELRQQPAGVRLHGVLAHVQPFGDLAGAQPRRDELQDLVLPWRDPEPLEACGIDREGG